MQNLYNNTKSTVIVGRSNTEWFKQTVGIRQGCVLSPDLFNIYLENVMCEDLEGMEYIGASINGNRVNNLHFVHDIDLIARQLGDLQHQLNKVEEFSIHNGLEISETKTEWLVMRHEDSINTSGEQLTLKGKPLKKVDQLDQFRYLIVQ